MNAKHAAWKAILLRHETILLLVLVGEWVYFDSVGRNFGSLDSTFDIVRHSIEIGLLALVMTPIILTGGIDLSLGSLLGLCGIIFGKLWRDAGLGIPAAMACTKGWPLRAGSSGAIRSRKVYQQDRAGWQPRNNQRTGPSVAAAANHCAGLCRPCRVW